MTILAVLAINACTVAQVITNEQYEDELFRSRVKLVEGFMRRFNGAEILHTIDTTKAGYQQKNILSLFDAQMFGTRDDKDSVFKLARKFADDVLRSKVKLNNTDTNWVAIAPCHGKLKGKPVDFVLVLNTEKYTKDAYRWVIAKAQGEIFKLTPSVTSIDLLISPLAHEVNFMELGRITTQKDDWILNYKQQQYDLDQTAVFFTYVNAGLLDIENVQGLQFVFFQMPGWVFTIQEFDRREMNSGWLITSFSKMSDIEKQKYLNYVYNKK